MDVAVVGGGISGLSTAYKLMKDGNNVTLFEASGRTGGKIDTIRFEGMELDLGPITISETPELRQLIDELGLTSVDVSAASKKRYIYSKGKLHIVGPQMLFGSLLSLGGKLSMLKAPFANKKHEDESVASYATRKFGRQAYLRLFNPLMNGIYAGNSERLSAHTVIRKRAPRKIISLNGGIASLTQALSSKLNTAVKTNAPIHDLTELDRFDEVHLATPAFVTSSLISKLDHELAEKLSRINYSSVSQVFVETEPGVSGIDGFGFLVPSEERLSLLGAICISNILPSKVVEGRRVFVLFCGGDRPYAFNPTVDGAVAEFKRILKPANVRVIHIQHYNNSIPQFHVGYQNTLDHIRQFERQNLRYQIKGNFVTGVAVADCI